MEKPKYRKTYVPVNVYFDIEGRMLPRSLIWRDGHEYELGKVKDIQQAAALKAGGQGDRYTLIRRGVERHIFFEHNAEYGHRNVGRWFVEERIE